MQAINGVSNTHHHVTVQKKNLNPDELVFANASTVPATSAHQGVAQNSTETDSSGDQSSERVNEAFAKMKVALQATPGSGATNQFDASSTGSPSTKSAKEEFMDYMHLTPEEKVRAGMLADMGMTEEEYEALPPEEKAKIDKKIDELEKKKEDQHIAQLKVPVSQQSSALPSIAVTELEKSSPQDGYARKQKDGDAV